MPTTHWIVAVESKEMAEKIQTLIEKNYRGYEFVIAPNNDPQVDDNPGYTLETVEGQKINKLSKYNKYALIERWRQYAEGVLDGYKLAQRD